MNRFKSHKIVTAARIAAVQFPAIGAVLGALILEGHSTPVPMPRQWAAKHVPKAGGFLVQYDSGYSSYSPADAFEEGYHLIEDGIPHPVWPLRTSCEPEPLVQSVEQLPPVTLPKGAYFIKSLPDAVSIETCMRLVLRCHGDISDVMFVVSHDWYVTTKPELGGALVEQKGTDPIYYAPGTGKPALPTRVTSQALEGMFRSVTYEIRPDGRTTVCEITFHNGFTLRGESSAAHIDNFKQSLGEEYSLKDAMDRAWMLAGFLLMEDRHRAGLSGEAPPAVTTPAPAAKPDVAAMVNRFLGWKLPADFSPDCGITFKRESDYEHPQFGRTKYEPIGTNLLSADQAKAMFEHCLKAGK